LIFNITAPSLINCLSQQLFSFERAQDFHPKNLHIYILQDLTFVK